MAAVAKGRKKLSVAEFLRLTARYSNWNRWGKEDQLGTLNYITDDTVAEAAREVRRGEIRSLSIPLDSDGPQRGVLGRFNPIHYMIRDGADVVAGVKDPRKDHQIHSTDDVAILPLQCGTQWDSLAHIVHHGRIYNGYPATEVGSGGARKNSITNAKEKFVGRGVLLDMPRAFGKKWLEVGFPITTDILERVAGKEGVEIREGDIVLVRTGRMAMAKAEGAWGDYSGGPTAGLSVDAAEWLFRNRVAAVAADNFAVEVLPYETEEILLPLHLLAIVYMGLPLGEIFDLDGLSETCTKYERHTFFFSSPPLLVSGAVGSPINPVAVL